jgi:hypothetical protein
MDFETTRRFLGPAAAVCLWFVLPDGSASALDPQAYRTAFAYHCLEADIYVQDITPLLYNALDSPLLTAVGIAVVFPELTRYSYIRDAVETKMMELSYIMGGTIDFSIGLLQMKPSFAEMIENDGGPLYRDRFPELFQTGGDSQKTRGLRILRLKNLQRQAEYLAVFLGLMIRTFPQLSGDPDAMVRVFSAAYNGGYKRSLEELEAHRLLYLFPYGKTGGPDQYSYVEIALDYFRRTQ